MQLVRLEPPPAEPRSAGGGVAAVVAVGNFDGVHRGHQALIARTLSEARTAEGSAVVLTFDPHPARVLHPERAPGRLLTLDQKAEILAAQGIDVLALLPFTSAVAALTPSAFAASILAARLHARAVVVGEQFRFGQGRKGEVADLRRAGRALGFDVHAVPAVLEGGHPVSSTRIRERLDKGDPAGAQALLGRPYFVEGAVVRGEGRGRTLGIPTANLAVENEVLPAPGVYAVRASVIGAASLERKAVVNLGRRPTFGGSGIRVEAHLLDFEGDLYGQRMRLSFLARLREESTFPGKDALVEQIRADILRARALLDGRADGV